MAKLKITDNAGNIIPTGYVRVVNNLILNEETFYEFVFAEPDERADILQRTAQPDIIKQQRADGQLEAITNNNCKILGEKDVKQKPNKKSKVTIPIPDSRPTSVDYLEKYAETIHNFYTAGDKASAHKFLFGVMLLTRCR